jgi:predicted ATPase/class 3 adenylate cyclase/DNA-binding CsgD family transcriptional regulator
VRQVTYLFTDIAGSTERWSEHPDVMGRALDDHMAIVTAQVEATGGEVENDTGDGIFAVFPTAHAAVSAAVAAQETLTARDWGPVRELPVRIGIHTGAVDRQTGEHRGTAVNRAARIMGAAHGGQILVSEATRVLVRDDPPKDVGFIDLGLRRLRGLPDDQRVFQVTHPVLQVDFPPIDCLAAPTGNLPSGLSSFVGRASEVAEIVALLRDHRLVTLTGVGGVGKTRLAVEVARRLAGDFPGGAWLVGLGSVDEDGAVVPVFVSALGVAVDGHAGRDLLDRITAALRSQEVLLVVDDCEHVLGDVRRVVSRVLADCPGARVIATSRQPLGIDGERVLRIPPLAAEAAEGERIPDAVQLLLDRAAAAGSGLPLDGEDGLHLERICRQLDGIPLAIELVAARIGHQSPREIADRLETQLELPISRGATKIGRHRTLTSALDWSHDLLSPAEQTLLRSLAVFAGGATLQAVGAICLDGADEAETFALISSLVDKSLVSTEWNGDLCRYRMLKTVRHYALGRLTEAGENREVRHRHAVWLNGQVTGGGSGDLGFSRLNGDQDDLLTALRWSIEEREVDLAVGLAAATWKWWEITGRVEDGRGLLDRVLTMAGSSPDLRRARLVTGAASLALAAGDYDAATRLHQQNLADLEALGAGLEAAATLNSLATVAVFNGDHDEARRLASEALTRFRVLEDEGGMGYACSTLGITAAASGSGEEAVASFIEALRLFRRAGLRGDAASVLNELGNLAADAGDSGRAHRFYEGALQLHGEIGDDRGAALSLNNLAISSQRRGNLDRAWEHAEEARRLFQRVSDRPGEAATLNNLANIADEREDPKLAIELYGESARLFRDVGDARGVATTLENLSDLARRTGQILMSWQCRVEAAGLRLGLGQIPLVIDAFEALLDMAGATSQTAVVAELSPAVAEAGDDRDALEAVLELARWLPVKEDSSGARVESDASPDLTKREIQVVALVGRGLSNKEIAAELFISERTVESHIAHVRSKLGVDSRTRLVLWAVEHDLVSDS